MEVNEFRIGNWIVYKYENGYHQVDEVRRQPVLDGYYYSVNKKLPEHIQPIPLSPEILEKCGFAKEVLSYVWYRLTVNEDFIISIRFDRENDIVYISSRSNVFCLPTSIKHLHQLQNLYFALTQTELNIVL